MLLFTTIILAITSIWPGHAISVRNLQNGLDGSFKDIDARSPLLPMDPRHVSYASINLEHFNSTNELERRLSITECLDIIGKVNTCFDFANNIRSIGSSIASAISSASNNGDCGPINGGIVSGNDAIEGSWSYFAKNGGGKNCNAKAEIKTFRGAIDNWLAAKIDKSCNNWCIRWTHGSGYSAVLALSPAGFTADATRCPDPDSSANSYDSCESHGGGSDLGS